MPAIKDEIAEAEEEGIDFRFLIQPVKIHRARSGRLEAIFQRMELGAPDKDKRRKGVPIKDEFLTLEADRIISAVGEWVDTSWVPEKLISEGLIEAGSVPDIFAGGDAVSQTRTIATAIATAKKAAISMDLFFRGIHDRDTLEKIQAGNKGSISMGAYIQSRETGICDESGEVVSPGQINTLYFEKSKRAKVRKLGIDKRRRAFQEVNLGIDAKKAALSASRCYSCGTCNACYDCSYFCPEGVISIDPDTRTRTIDTVHCKGCGICARSCPRHAVFMKDLS
jgi:Pyruvate/2-oxoacid:ferredoxin oxidoreductase delta subunit